MKRQRPVDLRIDELLLPAMPHGGERRLREAIEAELRRALAGQGQRLDHGHASTRQRIDAGELTLAPGDHAGTVGPRVARQIGREVLGE